jgi:ubiquinone/menaquinone biosynthesis C-methylase UbiE
MPDRSPADLPHPLFGRIYARLSTRMEPAGMGALRDELLANLTGRVIEIGAGNGLNLAHYPSTVREVVAVEPEPYLRGLATESARTAPVPATVLAGQAARLPLPDGSVDAAVFCLVMCSLPDRAAALAEVRRVLRPGGTVRFLEHTLAATPGLRTVQRLLDATVWPLLMGGCHTARDPQAAFTAAGFEVTDLRRLRFPDIRLTQPTTLHVLGTARVAEAR